MYTYFSVLIIIFQISLKHLTAINLLGSTHFKPFQTHEHNYVLYILLDDLVLRSRFKLYLLKLP